MDFDVLIVGGGAAGLMCAIEAGRRGRKTALVEHNAAIGKKIRISGGGRCNFTNTETTPDHFISENPNFHKSALARYTPRDFVNLVRRHRIAFHEKKHGQLFCDTSSDQIIDMLRLECDRAGVDILTGCTVAEVSKNDRFHLVTSKGSLSCQSLVIATGGLTVPKIGASDFGYRIARQFGLAITSLRPALVPLTFEGAEGAAFRELSGVSVNAIVRSRQTSFRENVLFTHRGLSGPAILQISSYWLPGESITIDLLPEVDPDASILPSRLQQLLPKRFAQKWCEMYGADKPWAQWSRKDIDEFKRRMRGWEVTPSGTEGYAKAEVTLGGVATSELSSKTMESRRVPGLYFIGEVVDVTGQLGGFNFQWAWSSGFVTGQYV